MLKAHLHLPLFGKVLELIIQSSALTFSKRHRLCRSKATKLSSIFALRFYCHASNMGFSPFKKFLPEAFHKDWRFGKNPLPCFQWSACHLENIFFSEYFYGNIFFCEYFEENIFSALLATLDILASQNILKIREAILSRIL